jgi:hypothetical protein
MHFKHMFPPQKKNLKLPERKTGMAVQMKGRREGIVKKRMLRITRWREGWREKQLLSDKEKVE